MTPKGHRTPVPCTSLASSFLHGTLLAAARTLRGCSAVQRQHKLVSEGAYTSRVQKKVASKPNTTLFFFSLNSSLSVSLNPSLFSPSPSLSLSLCENEGGVGFWRWVHLPHMTSECVRGIGGNLPIVTLGLPAARVFFFSFDLSFFFLLIVPCLYCDLRLDYCNEFVRIQEQYLKSNKG